MPPLWSGLDSPQFVVYDNPCLHEAIPQYTRFRDYFRNGSSQFLIWNIWWYPHIAVVKIISESVNATLVSGQEVVTSESTGTFPQVKIEDSIFWSRLKNYRNRYYDMDHGIPEGVRLVKIDPVPWNFVVCTVSRKERISLWDFSLFLSPLDSWTWLLLITCFFFVVQLSGEFSRVIMPIVSAIFSNAVQTIPGKSVIFIIWIGACMLLGNLYSGELTSKIMVPPKDEVITYFRQLEEQNYTALVPMGFTPFMKSLGKRNFSKLSPGPGKVIRRLTRRPIFVEDKLVPEILAFDKRRLVTIGPWPRIHVVPWTNQYRQSQAGFDNPENKNKKPKICHVGKELAHWSEQFFIFLPPQNFLLVQAFQKLVESGIYQRWDQEMIGLMHSRRVQDRVRVKSPTIVLEMEQVQLKPQAMKGKVVTMFLLWSVCLVISLSGFCVEIVTKSGFSFRCFFHLKKHLKTLILLMHHSF